MTQMLVDAPAAPNSADNDDLVSSTQYTKEAVAELSLLDIEVMTRDELIDAIRAVVVPFVDQDRLQFQERRTLLRLLYLARKCCRNQGY